jgi:hypothetical protein
VQTPATQREARRELALGRALEQHADVAAALDVGRAPHGGVVAGLELTLVDDGEGRCHGRITVPSHVGAMLKRHLLALANPSRHSDAELRRLACEAGIIPTVLGTSSQPLDLGRTARLYSKAQRIALGLRDGGCTAKGCETSASGCHAHHDDPCRLGLTDLANGRLLGPRHHRLAHGSRYAMTVHADNKVTFARRT